MSNLRPRFIKELFNLDVDLVCTILLCKPCSKNFLLLKVTGRAEDFSKSAAARHFYVNFREGHPPYPALCLTSLVLFNCCHFCKYAKYNFLTYIWLKIYTIFLIYVVNSVVYFKLLYNMLCKYIYFKIFNLCKNCNFKNPGRR